MKNKITLAICSVLVLGVLSISAWAQTGTSSVWTNANGVDITDPQTGCRYLNFSGFNAATSWNETSFSPNPADAHFRGVAEALGIALGPCPNTNYEFTLVSSTITGPDSITGAWDIFRNSSLVCSACTGTASGLSQAAGAGNYYEVYIDDPVAGIATWLYSGYIDQRKDF
jgi:hypothetical protein